MRALMIVLVLASACGPARREESTPLDGTDSSDIGDAGAAIVDASVADPLVGEWRGSSTTRRACSTGSTGGGSGGKRRTIVAIDGGFSISDAECDITATVVDAGAYTIPWADCRLVTFASGDTHRAAIYDGGIALAGDVLVLKYTGAEDNTMRGSPYSCTFTGEETLQRYTAIDAGPDAGLLCSGSSAPCSRDEACCSQVCCVGYCCGGSCRLNVPGYANGCY